MRIDCLETKYSAGDKLYYLTSNNIIKSTGVLEVFVKLKEECSIYGGRKVNKEVAYNLATVIAPIQEQDLEGYYFKTKEALLQYIAEQVKK
jgi:hypothetical protein